MSETAKGLVVTFSEDVRDDYAEKIKQAIELFDGVGTVRVLIKDFEDRMSIDRAKMDMQKKIFDVLK